MYEFDLNITDIYSSFVFLKCMYILFYDLYFSFEKNNWTIIAERNPSTSSLKQNKNLPFQQRNIRPIHVRENWRRYQEWTIQRYRQHLTQNTERSTNKKRGKQRVWTHVLVNGKQFSVSVLFFSGIVSFICFSDDPFILNNISKIVI